MSDDTPPGFTADQNKPENSQREVAPPDAPEGGLKITTGPTKNPKYPGGKFSSAGTDSDHTTIIQDSDGNVVEIKKKGKGV